MPKVNYSVDKKPQGTRKKQEKIICQSPNCERQGKEQALLNFYDTGSELLPKYPVCKKCVQSLIDINNMNTVYKILQEMNKPFLQDVWDNVFLKSPTNPFGSYIRQINSLPQHKGLFWKDSVFERESVEDLNFKKQVKVYDPEWAGYYTDVELDYLNNYYKGLHNDFKIVTTNHKDYARKIAQASLAVNKAFQEMSEGVAGADKKYKDLQSTFDTLSKSAQFSESQRGINDVSLGCFGVIFDKVEQKKWIPQHTPLKKDDYDKLIDYFSSISKSV